jgi:hypothetical protein
MPSWTLTSTCQQLSYLFLLILAVRVEDCASALVTSVGSEAELYSALADHNVTSIAVTSSVTLSAAAWPLNGEQPTISRNLSISSGTQNVSSALDFSHLYRRVHLRPNVTVVFEGITLKGTQSTELLSMAFFIHAAGSNIVWHKVLSEQDVCPPPAKLLVTFASVPLPPGYAGAPRCVVLQRACRRN